MRCPFCGVDDDRVVDTRTRTDGAEIRRRRLCNQCGRRFITLEGIEQKTLSIIKSDGRRESFDPVKLRRSIEIACKKRPISTDQIDRIVDRVKSDIDSDLVYEIPSMRIGELVIQFLRELDEVAYVRFASVYRNFKDKEEFLKELNEMKDRSSGSPAEPGT
ncbi:transcriptional repressor NrdR [bacterium]|nr:transcriptional repressor NrdR [bacterium]